MQARNMQMNTTPIPRRSLQEGTPPLPLCGMKEVPIIPQALWLLIALLAPTVHIALMGAVMGIEEALVAMESQTS